MPAIQVNERVVVPEEAVDIKAVRASGPGGQHVNKTASKVQMWIDLGRLAGLQGDELFRLREFLKSRLDADGRLLVSSQDTRDQSRNREDCFRKAIDLLRAGLVRPKHRRPTRPTRNSKLRRVEAKRHNADRLRNRRVEE